MWDMCQILNIWHISHTKHKNQLPSDVAYVPKLYYICLYRCKFATVQTDVVKPNNVLYLLLSLLSLPVLTLDFFSLSSHIKPKHPSTAQQRKNKMTLRLDPRRSRSSLWARPLRLDHRHRHRHRRRKRYGQGHSDHPHHHCCHHRHRHRCFDLVDLYLSFLVVGCFDCWWLADFGWWW